MADVQSADLMLTGRVHTDWASVLVWSKVFIPWPRWLVYRDGEPRAALGPSRQVWYDHYAPLGVPVSYHVNNGIGTTDPLTITVPDDPQRRAWLKSAVDPNLSTAISNGKLTEATQAKKRGVFDVFGRSAPFVIESGMGSRQRGFEWNATDPDTRDRVLALLEAGPFLVQLPSTAGEPDMWSSAGDVSVTRAGTVLGNVVWQVSAELTEIDPPASALAGNRIPGWGWRDVAALHNSWDDVANDYTSWVDLVCSGVA